MMTSRRVVVGLLTAVVVAWSCGVGPATAQLLINGAGATFPYPIYSKWFDEYAKISRSVNFNYQSIGSGGGIRQITARTVDFGATEDRKSTRLNSSHLGISYAVFCLKKKTTDSKS